MTAKEQRRKRKQRSNSDSKAGMEKGLMIVVSGPAGSGKGTVNAHLLKTGNYAFSVSATTRAPRPGEIDGVNYYYVSKEDFEKRISEGGMLEYTEYCGNYYGTPKEEALRVIEGGKNLILEIEVEGAMNIKRAYPEAVLIMLLPPSYKKQEERLRSRGTETEEKILARLKRAREEIAFLPKYDYVVYNEDNCDKEAAAEIESIVRAEKSAVKRNSGAIDKFFENK